jgi:hypothetical protein
MPAFTGPVEAFNALQTFLIERTAALPDNLRDEMLEAITERSPVVAVIRGVEAVYARQRRKEDVPAEMLLWAADASAMTEDHGFHGMDKDGRGSKIAKVLRGQTIAEKNKPALDEVAVRKMDPPPEPPPIDHAAIEAAAAAAAPLAEPPPSGDATPPGDVE